MIKKQTNPPVKLQKIEVLVPKDSRLFAINKLASAIDKLASALSCATQVNVSNCEFKDIVTSEPAMSIKTVSDEEYQNASDKFVRES